MKKSSYQKQKERIAELEKDINTLVFHPESIDANLIRGRREFNRDMAETAMFGIREGKFNGIIEQVYIPIFIPPVRNHRIIYE